MIIFIIVMIIFSIETFNFAIPIPSLLSMPDLLQHVYKS
jgi:hypothetical protein